MNWTKIDAYQFRRNICLGFFLFFLQSAALKRVTEKQNEIILEKIVVWEKLKMRYWNMSKGRNLNAQRSWKKTINGKKTRQEQRRIPDYELSNGLWVYHLYFLISLQKGNANGRMVLFYPPLVRLWTPAEEFVVLINKRKKYFDQRKTKHLNASLFILPTNENDQWWYTLYGFWKNTTWRTGHQRWKHIHQPCCLTL